jgi:hypothetical protein
MTETLFGSGSPMWTSLPSSGFVMPAPIPFGTAPIPTPVFGSSMLPNAASGFPASPQTLPAPGAVPAQTYGYGAGVTPTPQGIVGPGFVAPSPFAPQPSGVVVSSLAVDATTGVTVPALLAAVAMRRGQVHGPTNDQEIEDFIYDALELLPNAADVEVRCEGGRTTLTGTVQHKRVKRDIGEIVWAIPTVSDVQNNVAIASRRRARAASREAETPSTSPSRKTA